VTGREEATVTGKNEAAAGKRDIHVGGKGRKKRKYKFLTDK
jgi:hypothetical protein